MIRYFASALCGSKPLASGEYLYRSRVFIRPQPGETIGYVTDIEGNLEYWKKYKAISKVLDTTDGNLKLKPNCYLVFGGDVCDRGSGDKTVSEELVKLKEENPDRVFLILGNRDTNKIRLLSELQPQQILRSPQPYWLTKPLSGINDHTFVARIKTVRI
jgi:hypothetical protein